METEVKEWRLITYRCFHESENGSVISSTEKSSATTSSGPDGVWLTRRDHAAAILLLRLSDYGHLAIMQGCEVVESYFLILAKKWVKAVNIGRYLS